MQTRISTLAAIAIVLIVGQALLLQRDVVTPPSSTVEVTKLTWTGELPQKLSDIGLFKDLSNLTPNHEVDLYEVKYPLWTDNAGKARHVHIPTGEAVELDDNGYFAFPNGTILSKTFSLGQEPEEKIETRIIAKFDDDWVYGVYVWNDEQTEAVLWNGDDIETDKVLAGDNKHYVIPGRPKCLQCHSGLDEAPLGFAAFQLTSQYLADLKKRGKIKTTDSLEFPHDEVVGNSKIEREAMGYLAGNCGHCHREERVDTLGVELILTAGSDPRTLISQIPSRLRSKSTKALVVPGSPEESVLYRSFCRDLFDGSEGGRGSMPPLGAQMIDPHGKELLHSWITSMPGTLHKTPFKTNTTKR